MGAGSPAQHPLQRRQAGAYVFPTRQAAQHPRDFVGAGLPALHPILRVNSVHVRNAIAVMLANVGGRLLLQGYSSAVKSLCNLKQYMRALCGHHQ